MTEEDIRKEAIQQHVMGGESPKTICKSINRSKQWFFKWLKRYKTGAVDWYKEQSRAPKTSPLQITPAARERIILTRQHLEASPYAQVGVSAIKWELKKLGLPFPADRTINRVIRDEGLVKKTAYVRKGVEYPYFTEALCSNNIHQMDLVGPRYIKGDGRFYSMNVIDLFDREVYIESQRTKEDSHVCQGLLRCWKTMGIPDYLQMDNALNFRGSNRYPRSFGMVIRLCLAYGVHPVFIPVAEPWRNGVVEHFNDTYDKKFYRRQWFSSYVVLKRQSKNFQRFHNKHHHYSFLKGKTPFEMRQSHEFTPVTVGSNTKMPDLSFIPDGYISVIRFIRSDQKLDIFGERFEVSKDLIYSYVRAMIVTQLHAVQLYLGNEIVDTFEYKVPNDL